MHFERRFLDVALTLDRICRPEILVGECRQRLFKLGEMRQRLCHGAQSTSLCHGAQSTAEKSQVLQSTLVHSSIDDP